MPFYAITKINDTINKKRRQHPARYQSEFESEKAPFLEIIRETII